MIKNTFYIALLLLISGCSSGKGEFELKGSVDLKDGDMVLPAQSNYFDKDSDLAIKIKKSYFDL